MNIFAIDLGNKRVKMKSDRGEYTYPASYLSAEHVGVRGLTGIPREGNLCFQLEDDGEHNFIWGPELGIYNLSEKIIDTYARSERMRQKKAQRLLKFALGRLALDYKESKKKGLIVHLMLGVPISDLHQESKTIEDLKDFLIGKHTLLIEEEEVIFDIPSEDYISIVPQYMGTVLELAFDDSMKHVETYAKGRIGIVDIGGGTILINSANHMTPSPIGSESFEGINILIKDIANRTNSTKPFIIETALRSGNTETGYIYSPNRNEANQRDISEIVKEAIDKYTRFTVAPLISGSFPDLEEVDLIIMTGGGANIISKDALIDEIGESYFSRLIFVENGEQANVRGYYKGAYLLWDEDKEYLMDIDSSEVTIEMK